MEHVFKFKLPMEAVNHLEIKSGNCTDSAVFMLYGICPNISADQMWLRYAAFIALYAVWVIGYTFQTSVTRSGQTVLTNDPNQRICR